MEFWALALNLNRFFLNLLPQLNVQLGIGIWYIFRSKVDENDEFGTNKVRLVAQGLNQAKIRSMKKLLLT